MTKTQENPQAGLQRGWTTSHAAAVASVNQSEVETTFKSFFDPQDVSHKLIFASTRTGMSCYPLMPQVLNLVDKPKR